MKRKRPQLGIIVMQETKDVIQRMAKKSGCSMGQIAERLIEEALFTRRLLSLREQDRRYIRSKSR